LRATSLKVRAPAKINLWLRVFAPDETGYHPLDTLFCAIDLADEIEIAEGDDGIELIVRGADVGPADKNLAHRAAAEYFTATGISPRIRIVLQKNIPAGAGLGGGSSDAAAVLLALNELNGNVLPLADLMAMGARIGSDVPFFMCGSRVAHATGRGEVLTGLPPLPRAPAIIVAPKFSIATAQAYGWLDEARAYEVETQRAAASTPADWSGVAQRAFNSFESVLFARIPELARARDEIRRTGAEIAMVSGSGSALFGIYESAAHCEKAAALLGAQMPDAVVIRTVAS
jgi:4-diphosphocytidyl-2-C-methyl-D-erythritol kinase